MAEVSDAQTIISGKSLKPARWVWWGVTFYYLGVIVVFIVNLIQNYQQHPIRMTARRIMPVPVLVLENMLDKLDWPVGRVIFAWEFMSFLPVVVYLGIAFLLYLRRQNIWMAYIASLFLISQAVVNQVALGLRFMIPSGIWVEFLNYLINSICVLLFFLYFPNGKLFPKRPRFLILVYFLLSVPWFLFITNTLDQAYQVFLISSDSFFNTIVNSTFITYLLMIAIQVFRYRSTSDIKQKNQLKWLAWGAAISLMIYAGVNYYYVFIFEKFALTPNVFMFRLILNSVYELASLIIPITIMIAIMRHQWLNINLVINRSLVYGALSIFLVGVFGISLFLLSRLFGDNANAGMLSVAVTAGVFGFTFRSLHRRVQHFVDRRFYNIQIDYQKTPVPSVVFSGQPQKSLGQYSNLKLIGRGGMAEVYQANHPNHLQPVAVKLLPADLSDTPEFRYRFEREAKVVSMLEHPNIIKIHEFGEIDGIPFIAMEYLAGQDLSFYLQKVGAVPIEDAVSWVEQIASALDYAHRQGIVHRDIKPSNIMLDSSGNGFKPVLMDFGIAKILEGATRITQSGFLGTLDYIAPEQIQASSEVDHHADIYALGILTYQMLTGELPYKFNNAGALLMAHLTQEPPDPRDVQPNLSSFITHALSQAMAKAPKDRYQTAGQFGLALAAA